MTTIFDHDGLETALRQVGSSWSASQAHGLLCGRMALLGAEGSVGWFAELMESGGADRDAIGLLEAVAVETYRQLNERQSEFEPLLPADPEPATVVAAAISDWCEGFLHGLVSTAQNEAVKARMAAEPVSDIIRDMLEITRATADDDDDDEDNEQALTELNEYLRVAVQLVYEELADERTSEHPPSPAFPSSDALH